MVTSGDGQTSFIARTLYKIVNSQYYRSLALKFGDIIRNTWAGEGNPHMYGMFISNKSSARTIRMVHSDGDIGDYSYKDIEKEYPVVGHINIKQQLVAFGQPNSETAESCQLPITGNKTTLKESLRPKGDITPWRCKGCGVMHAFYISQCSNCKTKRSA